MELMKRLGGAGGKQLFVTYVIAGMVFRKKGHEIPEAALGILGLCNAPLDQCICWRAVAQGRPVLARPMLYLQTLLLAARSGTFPAVPGGRRGTVAHVLTMG